MVDDGAPYSAIGTNELRMVYGSQANSVDSLIETLPGSISKYRFWQFGYGQHASPAKPIKGSIMLRFKSDTKSTISIRDIAVDGSRPWVIGRNVTRKCDIVHINGNHIRFPPENGLSDTTTMIDFDQHSYIPLSSVDFSSQVSPPVFCLAGFTAQMDDDPDTSAPDSNRSWPQLKRIVDRVHEHTCGHSTFSDIRSLLSRNQLWSPAVEHYL